MRSTLRPAVEGTGSGLALRLYALLCGYEFLPKTVSTRGRGHRIVLAEPICAYLIETEQGLVLFDTGVNASILHDPALRERYYLRHGWMVPVVRPEHELLAQLDAIGVSTGEIGQVILSHMHLDHTGNLGLFPQAEVVVQRREHEYAFSPGHSPFWFDRDYEDSAIRWRLVEGDVDLAPGVRALHTPGHTFGHQSLLIELAEAGPCVLVGDAADLRENLADEVLPGAADDDRAALDSIRRINGIVGERGAKVFFTHDPNFVQEIRLAPEYYR